MRIAKPRAPALGALVLIVLAPGAGFAQTSHYVRSQPAWKYQPAAPQAAAAAALLDPSTQPRFVNPLPILGAYTAQNADPATDYYEIQVTQFRHWFGLYDPSDPTALHPTPTTRRLNSTVWGYGPLEGTGTVPGRTFETKRGKRVVVKWINNLRNPDGTPMTQHLFESQYDTTLHGTDGHESCFARTHPPGTQEPHVRMVVHNHGAEVRSDSDGFPDFWFTPNPFAGPNGCGGPPGNSVIYTYPNQQPPMTLWYHDHALGVTRMNIYAGQAGFFLVRDPLHEGPLNLPSGKYEIPLILQDKRFYATGEQAYVTTELFTPNSYHPKIPPEFFGDFITVNGRAWPFLNVEPRKYRFRILNASNARMFNLRLVEPTGKVWPHVFQIGSDGGYLAAPVLVDQSPDQLGDGDITDPTTKLFLAQAERVDVVIDFSKAAVGQTFLFENDAVAPFPSGLAPDPSSSGQVMQFRVVPLTAPDTSGLPAKLNYLPTRLVHSDSNKERHLVITEIEDPVTGTPTVALINNTCWEKPRTEDPIQGATEVWEVTNMTPDTHPIHLHLIEFNLFDRQQFDKNAYMRALNQANGTNGSVISGDASDVGGPVLGPPPFCSSSIVPPSVGVGGPATTNRPMVVPDVTPYLIGSPIPPNPTEAGFKDTIRVKHNTVTRFLVKFSPQDPADGTPSGLFTAFDPTVGEYVWHCHITEHEDNEMMRPYKVH
jgi:FtsP/CotA-like multicopper oxidase with cupredoxin domain